MKRSYIIATLTFILLYPIGKTEMTAAPEKKSNPVIIGSKNFNESYILAEIFATLLEEEGIPVVRRFGLGGTMICFTALKEKNIDLYPEYTGTIERVLLHSDRNRTVSELNNIPGLSLHARLLDPLGFNNTYVIAVKNKVAAQYGIQKISDLQNIPSLRYGFNHEFVKRPDGWPMIATGYGISIRYTLMNHSLLFRALESGQIDVMDAFKTDGELLKYNLRLLEDDLGLFPDYHAVPFIRSDLDPKIADILSTLKGKLSDERMRSLNYMVVSGQADFQNAAHEFLRSEGLLRSDGTRKFQFMKTMFRRLLEHILLTFSATVAAALIAIPFAVFIHKAPGFSGPILYISGLFQTIPSIALLAFMIPLFGIGVVPAIAALFLYALLPVLRNTYSSLLTVDPALVQVSVAMGMTSLQRLRLVEFPLALPGIFAGIRTATVINIGTATLSAFIGAGGLGEPIVTGLALNDTGMILEGAIPAAVLAIVMELIFESVEKRAIPAHIRK